MSGLKTSKENGNIGNSLKTSGKTETGKKTFNTVSGIKTGNSVIHTLAKTSKKVIQTGSSTIKTTSKVAESQDSVEAIKTSVEGYGKATKGVIRTGKKVVDKAIRKYGSKRWGIMKNVGKGYKKLKGAGSGIKTLATQAGKEDAFEATTGYTKTIANYSTRPVRKVVKKLAKETAKAVGKVMHKLVTAIAKFIASCWPFILGVLLVCVCYLCITSVFGGFGSIDSPQTQEEYQAVIDRTENVFQKLEDKKVQELKEYTDKEKKRVGEGKAPAKSEFTGISDEDYKKLVEEQWKPDQFVEESISYIDYKGLAVISQYYLENDDKQLQQFIDKLDGKGLIETYSTMSMELEYEVKWVAWTEHKVNAKTKEEVIAKAGEYKDKKIEVGEPTKTGKDKWEMVVKTGEEKTKKMKYTQYSVYINNGTFDQFINEIDRKDMSTEYGKNMDSLMQVSYESETFMSVFAKNWDKGGTATAGGKYIGGIANGKLFNWKGKPSDFSNSAFQGSLVGQCTWFAGGRWSQTHNKYCPMTGNAGQWLTQAQQAGLSIGKAPRPHSVIVLGGGSTPGYEGCGHVAFVEEVKMENGKVTGLTISQGNVLAPSQEAVIRNPFAYTDTREYKSLDEYMSMWGQGLYFVGFIY